MQLTCDLVATFNYPVDPHLSLCRLYLSSFGPSCVNESTSRGQQTSVLSVTHNVSFVSEFSGLLHIIGNESTLPPFTLSKSTPDDSIMEESKFKTYNIFSQSLHKTHCSLQSHHFSASGALTGFHRRVLGPGETQAAMMASLCSSCVRQSETKNKFCSSCCAADRPSLCWISRQ